jgi:hypothetical protein
MSSDRRLKRKQQLQEIRNSYCRKCGDKLIVTKGDVICKGCGARYGKVRDRV